MSTRVVRSLAGDGSRSASIRWSGAAAVTGGIVWIVATALHGSKPRGCIADECLTASMRRGDPAVGILVLSAVVLILIGAVGLLAIVRRSGRGWRLARVGAGLAGAGTVVIVVAAAIQAWLFAGDLPHMPTFVIPGILSIVVGVIVWGTAVLRSGVLPRWVASLLVLGAVTMLAFNEQTSAVFFAIPMAVAWIATGYVLWSGRGLVLPAPEATTTRG